MKDIEYKNNTLHVNNFNAGGKPLDALLEQSKANPSGFIYRKDIKDNMGYWINSGYSDELQTDFSNDSYLDSKLREVPSGKSFMLITDTHLPSSVRHSTQIVSYIKQRLHIDSVIFGGDCVNAEDNKYMAAMALSEYADEFFSAFGIDGIWVQGNHDANYNKYYTSDTKDLSVLTDDIEVYNRTVKNIEDFVIFDEETIELLNTLSLSSSDLEAVKSWFKLHYYRDDTKNKLRYIVMETGSGSYGCSYNFNEGTYIIAPEASMFLQFELIYKALITLPAGYKAVMVGHEFGDWNRLQSSTWRWNWQLVRLLSAFNTGGSISIDGTNITNTNFRTLWLAQNNKSITHIYDFSHKENDTKVFMICGHWHMDGAFVYHTKNGVFQQEEYDDVTTIGDDAVLLIWVPTDAYNARAYKPAISKLNHITSPQMTPNTTTECCFDIVTVKDEQIICTRIGAGNNRIFNY